MSGKGTINILYQFDENYAPYAGISITSLLINCGCKVHCFLLTTNTDNEDIRKVISTINKYGGEATVLDASSVNEKLESLNFPKYRGNYTTNFKLFIDDLIPKDIERIAYIDSDSIITGDISQLNNIEMADYPIGMVLDSVSNDTKEMKGFKPEDHYFNGGFILFNMPVWRSSGIQDEIINHVLTTHKRYAAPDQDLINIVLKDRIMLLHPRYNLQPTHFAYSNKTYFRYFKPKGYYSENEIKEAVEKPVMLHTFRFLGEFPWHKNNLHPQNSYFDQYMEKSLWKNYVKQPSGVGTTYKIEKMMYRILPRRVFFYIFNKMFYRYIRNLIVEVDRGNDSD